MKIHDTSHIALRRSLRKLSTLSLFVAAVSLILTATSQAAIVFDNMSNYENGVTGAAISSTASTPNTFMGEAYTLAAGTTTITGFDVYPVNLSGTSYNGLKITIYVWGTVNTGTVNATTPAFSNLLTSYTLTSAGSFNSGVYYPFESASPGVTPGITLGTPLAISSTTIGITFNYQGTTDGGVTYNNVNSLSSIIAYGTAPTVGSLVLGGATGGYYRNANSEINGNFTSTFRSLGFLTNQSLAVRVYGNSTTATADIGLRAFDGTSTIKVACEPAGTLTSKLRISKSGTTYGILLVNPSDPKASKVHIQTSTGVMALQKLP
jgi:hypothetical protein